MRTMSVDNEVADVYIKEAFSILNDADTEFICSGIQDIHASLTPMEVKQIRRKVKRGVAHRHIPWKAIVAAVLVAVLGISFWAGAENGVLQEYYNQIQDSLNRLDFLSYQKDIVTPDGRPSKEIYMGLQAGAADIALVVVDNFPQGTELIKVENQNGEIKLVYRFDDETYLTILQHPAGGGDPYHLPLQDNTVKNENLQILGESAVGAELKMQDEAISYYFLWKNDTSRQNRPYTEYSLVYSGKGLNLDKLSKILTYLKYFS